MTPKTKKEIKIKIKSMSLDSRYLLFYEPQPYTKPTPMDKDKELLKKQWAKGVVRFVDIDYGNTIFVDWPKHLMPDEIKKKLLADQVLERLDCEFWKIIK